MRILTLRLLSKDPKVLCDFYAQMAGLTASYERDRCTLHCAHSQLIFEPSPSALPYHFAFNIAPAHLQAALSWVQSFAEPLPDSDTGEPIVQFPAWNAEAIYFLDPQNNVVELIARKNLPWAVSEDFDPRRDLHGISEIGTVLSDISEAFQALHEKAGIMRYSGDFERFCAAGSEEGLFILVPPNRNWFPTNNPSQSAPYKLIAERNKRRFEVHFDGNELEVHPDRA